MLLLLACDPGSGPDEVSDPREGRADDTAPSEALPDDTAASDDTGDTDPSDDTAPDTGLDTGPVGTDADGDGVTLEAGDCNDGNPWVYPGAEEWCDPVDHDCDGEPLAPGVCGKDQDARALWTTSWTPEAAWADDGVYVNFGSPAGFVGDLDGDGKSEILTGCDNCSWFTEGRGGSNAYLLPGGTVGRDLEPTSGARGWWRGSEGYVPGAVMDLGDWNGDGVADMAMTTSEGGGQSGVVRILYGPPSRWPSGVDASTAADVRIRSTGAFGFGGLAMTHGDFDADGLADIVASTYDDGEGWSPNGVWLLPGRGDAEAESTLRDEPWLHLGVDLAIQDTLNPGDLDGDGADDLVITTYQDRVFSFVTASGLDLRLGAGDDFAGFAYATFTAELGHICMTAPGDLDGDGLADWIAGTTTASSTRDDPGALYAISGGHRSTGTAETFTEGAQGWWAGSLERALGWQCHAGDVDGDGAAELFVQRQDIVTYRAGVFEWVVAPMSGMPAPGDPLPTGLVIAREDPDALAMDQVPSIGDYDGDGFNDILLSGYHDSDALGMGGFVIIPGWEIPWDDPSYW